jgi:hypothetical protein
MNIWYRLNSLTIKHTEPSTGLVQLLWDPKCRWSWR